MVSHMSLRWTQMGGPDKAAQPDDCIRSGAEDAYSLENEQVNHPCNGKPHNTNRQGNRDHSECKIMHDAIDGMGLAAGGSITMTVNWNMGGEPPELSNSPCQQCMGFLSARQLWNARLIFTFAREIP